MNADRPILILQMQRMGDIVLTFPLVLWLRRLYPDTPVWVVAERSFYEALMPMSPEVTYFPWEGIQRLRKERFHTVINLSHRPEAAWLAGSLEAERHVGPVMKPSESALSDGDSRPQEGPVYIRGDWQLYRAGLVNNNRHNRFHWADLNALDSVPLSAVSATRWSDPASPAAENSANGSGTQIGLFVGASEEAKRPKASYWAELVRELLNRGLRPVLLGGPAEKELGAEIKALAKVPVLDLCGRFKLGEFAKICSTLSLLITPDTGPMHVAAWSGLRTLNLSLGPVNPWETAPYPPGHVILRTSLSCTGCWKCRFPEPLCRDSLPARKVAFLAGRLASGKTVDPDRLRIPGMDVAVTGHDADGLFTLRHAGADARRSGRRALSLFWKEYFGARFGLWGMNRPAAAWKDLAAAHPRFSDSFTSGLAVISRNLAAPLRRGGVLDSAVWRQCPPMLRPLSGFLQPYLMNGDYTVAAYRDAMGIIEELASLRG